MSILRNIVVGVAGAALLTFAAHAERDRLWSENLWFIYTSVPAIYCVFDKSCKPEMTDTVVKFTPPGDTGEALLITRTYPGAAGTPGEGTMAFEYRLDLRGLKASAGDANCIREIALPFGTDKRVHYVAHAESDVFIVSKGDVGKFAPSRGKTGIWPDIQFPMPKLLCPGEETHFWGMASKFVTPVTLKATIYLSKKINRVDEMEVDVRAPNAVRSTQ